MPKINQEEYEGEETGVKKDKEWAIKYLERSKKYFENKKYYSYGDGVHDGLCEGLSVINQLDEPEVLSQKWIDEHRKSYTMEDSVEISDLQNLLVPKQEEVDRAYKDGYETGKQHTFYKGYLEGITDKGSEPETVVDVLADFYKSLERLKEVLGTEVEELEENV